MIDIGVDGFKTDGGEFVFGEGLQFADGRRGDEMRNLYRMITWKLTTNLLNKMMG